MKYLLLAGLAYLVYVWWMKSENAKRHTGFSTLGPLAPPNEPLWSSYK